VPEPQKTQIALIVFAMASMIASRLPGRLAPLSLDPPVRLRHSGAMRLRERLVNFAVAMFFRISCRWDIRGVEKVPAEGPAILISNHTSFFEGPFFYILLRPRRTIALAKTELWDRAVTRTFMTAWRAIPVDREGMDITAIRRCFGVLDDGDFLCIAPEGTRSPDGALQVAQPGTTFFASREGVPIVPMVQWGLQDLPSRLKRLRRTDVHIRIGDPFVVAKPGGGRLSADDRRRMADEMMARLAVLLPEDLRGAYADASSWTSDFVTVL